MKQATTSATGSAASAETLLLSFARAGYLQAEPAILQPAEPFLDLSGEDIRKSLYLTTDPSGEELCLRPDLTIPVARDYLASARVGQPAGFSYLGPVFRYRGSRPSEFLQAGIESFGRQDRAAADAEMLALALEATSAFGLKEIEIRTGDVALFNALIDALDLYPVWRRRLIKDFNRKTSLAQDLERLTLATASSRNEFESRVGFMVARGIDTAATRFSTSFGRGLDYYTGFEFELHARGNGIEPLVAGGRYDGLMTQLGAPSPIPAVGFSVWVEALSKLSREPATGGLNRSTP